MLFTIAVTGGRTSLFTTAFTTGFEKQQISAWQGSSKLTLHQCCITKYGPELKLKWEYVNAVCNSRICKGKESSGHDADPVQSQSIQGW